MIVVAAGLAILLAASWWLRSGEGIALGSRRGRRALVAGGLVALGVLWAAVLLAVADGVLPATPEALRASDRPTVEPGAPLRPVAELRSDVPGWMGRPIAWPSPLPGARPIGFAELAIAVGTVGLVAVGLERRRAPASTIRMSHGAASFLATPARPSTVLAGGWEIRSTSGAFVVDTTRGGVVVVVGVGRVVLGDGIAPEIELHEGQGIAVSAYGKVGAVEDIGADELATDDLLWSQGTRTEVLAAIGAADDDSGPPPPGRRRWPLVLGAGAVALALLAAQTLLAQVVQVPSDSMAPTLEPGDRLVLDKRDRDVRAGDVVVFERLPSDRTSEELLLVKRVVAVGGQQVSIADGEVRVDGERLRRSWGSTELSTRAGATCGDTEWAVPDGAVFVLGDHRDSSVDSRCFGPVPGELVVGTIAGRLWPLGAPHDID